MNVFIDTNVLLLFYHLTSEDIEELKKLVALIDKKDIALLMPEQVKNEFYRNRESKISDALKKLREANLKLSFPAFCKDYEEYAKLRELIKEADKMHSRLVDRVISDATGNTLKADEIIKSIFASAQTIKVTDQIRSRANWRVQIGDPPGKGDSLGDAINWEALLDHVPNGQDLYFVSGDADYVSPLVDTEFNKYLADEWESIKKSEVVFFRRISEFFKDSFPDIHLASEIEKDALIQKLSLSPSFAHTHVLVGKLAKFDEFSSEHVEQLIAAAETNGQVGWILSDDDVRAFYTGVLKTSGPKLAKDVLKKLTSLVDEKQD